MTWRDWVAETWEVVYNVGSFIVLVIGAATFCVFTTWAVVTLIQRLVLGL